ncbi:DNA primase small subunit [Halomicrobium zhouii]|uniref:DNA primase small subunit PriS n=1 Tax=Halomicrobium zhouii TaxID=767519 RepID=A0A1I6LRI2_9EURY|nr:DNA primase small subunit PriS [Halomicrobium zhouii]SFS06066.1 DNA primase small subunit [Halomicrobium zhouii]
MEERTRLYLRGRFGDHYRRADITLPPDADAREWGFIPWTDGPGETMVRHRSLLDLGEIGDFLERKRPRHVYFSAGRYQDPSAPSMDEKTWLSSDLVFDLDADHLPAVELGEDSYAEMLEKCKDALLCLLDFLENDFGFDDLTVVFSGGRGYHVHVRDEGIQQLSRDSRREIVDYVRAVGLEPDGIQTKEIRPGNTAASRVLQTEGGWGQRVHDSLLAFVGELEAMDEEAALEELQELDGIGEGRAKTVYGAIQANREAIESGNLEAGGVGIRTLVETLLDQVVEEDIAPIDEPVTTDTNRLIRLPGSLHGGSGLAVQRIDRDSIEEFDPLVDAVPETFTGHEIAVEIDEDVEVELGGDTFTFQAGARSVPEHVGIFLMARGQAEKGPE